MTRYRSRLDPPTEVWERGGDNPSYVGRHGDDWRSVEQRAIVDRGRAHQVLDAATDPPFELRAAVILSVRSAA